MYITVSVSVGEEKTLHVFINGKPLFQTFSMTTIFYDQNAFFS